MAVEKEPILSRWSRLKRGDGNDGAETQGLEVEVGPQAPSPNEPVDADAPAPEEEMLTEADLPDIESLDYNSDFSAFMQKNVPLHLHKRAMQKLWRSDPVLANLDGLNDYDLDYSIKEAMEIAKESAADLARGTKRLNLSDQRMKDREQARAAAAAKEAEAAREAVPVHDGVSPDAAGEPEGPEMHTARHGLPESGEGEA